MKGAGVQYLIVIEMVVRMEKECKNTNEEENMKKNVKKVISFILSMLVIISTAVTPAMAAGTKEAPTEVKSVTASGLWTILRNMTADCMHGISWNHGQSANLERM